VTDSEYDSYGQRKMVEAIRAIAWALISLALSHIDGGEESLSLDAIKQAERELGDD
jgi:hypothetical protein